MSEKMSAKLAELRGNATVMQRIRQAQLRNDEPMVTTVGLDVFEDVSAAQARLCALRDELAKLPKTSLSFRIISLTPRTAEDVGVWEIEARFFEADIAGYEQLCRMTE